MKINGTGCVVVICGNVCQLLSLAGYMERYTVTGMMTIDDKRYKIVNKTGS